MHAIDVTLGVKAVASPACKIGGGVERGGIAERRRCESSRGNFETKSLSRTGIIFSVFLRLGGGEILYYLFILGSVHMEPSQPGKRGKPFRVFIWETLSKQGRFRVSGLL